MNSGPAQGVVPRVPWNSGQSQASAEASGPGLPVDKLLATCTPDTAPQPHPQEAGRLPAKDAPTHLSPGPLQFCLLVQTLRILCSSVLLGLRMAFHQLPRQGKLWTAFPPYTGKQLRGVNSFSGPGGKVELQLVPH